MTALPPLSAAVSGSFRRHLPEVRRAVLELEAAGVEVLSPHSTEAAGEEDGFVFLAGDSGPPAEVQSRHLAAIAASDFLWLVCPGGYVGPSALLEAGYARALGVPVFAAESPKERVAAEQVEVGEMADLVAGLSAERGQAPPEVQALSRLQQWAAQMVVARGFSEETLEELLLLLVEETAELVGAARQYAGYEETRFGAVFDALEELGARARGERKDGVAVEVGGRAKRDDVKTELADLEIYLAVIANKVGVELATAVRDKVDADRARVWRRQQDEASG